MLTAFDVGVAVLVLISAILATARGFTREILSLATWVGAAAVAAYLYFYQPDLLRPYFQEELIGRIVLVGAGFLISLIVLHLITMRIADFVVDSRIGPLDRTLGFVFGTARGVLIAVVAVIFLTWLNFTNSQSWVSESKTLPVLTNFGDSLVAMLPPDAEQWVTRMLKRGDGDDDASPEDAPAPQSPPDDSTDLPENDAPPATRS
jgi:membrane protein required for colicin V production